MKTSGYAHFFRNTVRGIPARQRINFFRQMAILTRAGVTLLASLKMLHRSSKGALRRLIGDTIMLIEQGNDFSKISRYYVKFFDKTIASMIRAGEQSGNLPEVTQQIFENLARAHAFKRKIRGALMMPLFTFIFAIGVIFFLALYVIPQFVGFLESMGSELPAITRMVLDVSTFIIAYWKEILIYSGAGIAGFFTLYSVVRPFKFIMHHIFIRLPLIGPMMLYTVLTDFSNSMAKLLGSGIGVVDSMKIADEGVWLLPIRSVTRDAMATILAGGDMSTAFERASPVPSIYSDLLQAGEQSGALDDVFDQLAIIYREEAEYKISALQAMIQPVMTILIGGIVGIVAASLILGMVSLWAKQG